MKKSRFSDQQIAFALQQAETGTSVADVCRKLGITAHLTEQYALATSWE
jgi:putative transposase